MKLKKWLKQTDSMFDVVIWGDDENEPLYKGSPLDIPWTIVNLEIGRKDNYKKEDDKSVFIADEPIFITTYRNEYGTIMPLVSISVIEE